MYGTHVCGNMFEGCPPTRFFAGAGWDLIVKFVENFQFLGNNDVNSWK